MNEIQTDNEELDAIIYNLVREYNKHQGPAPLKQLVQSTLSAINCDNADQFDRGQQTVLSTIKWLQMEGMVYQNETGLTHVPREGEGERSF